MARKRARRGTPDPKWNQTRREWELRIEVPTPEGQPRARKWIRAKTEQDCRNQWRIATGQLVDFAVVPNDQITLADVAARYLEAERKRAAAGTLAAYETRINLHVLPVLGAKRLRSLTTEDVDQWQEGLEAKGLSVAYRKEIRSALVKMINWAMARDLVLRNVAQLSPGPRGSGKRVESFTQQQAKAVLSALEGWRLQAAVVLMMTVGLRIGETLGLRWMDLSLEEGACTVSIRGQLVTKPSLHYQACPKTVDSLRTVDLPLRAVRALLEHREQQNQERQALGLGPAGPADYVFLTASQVLLDPSTLASELKGRTADLGLSVHPHKLRHTAASLMIDGGVPVEVVSKILGHKSIRTTLDIYGHLLDKGRATAAGAMDQALG